MKKAYWLDPKDKPGLLVNMMKFLAGDARIALEGDLNKFDLISVPYQIISMLKQNLLNMKLGFLMIR
jgi:hypothetical protein